MRTTNLGAATRWYILFKFEMAIISFNVISYETVKYKTSSDHEISIIVIASLYAHQIC